MNKPPGPGGDCRFDDITGTTDIDPVLIIVIAGPDVGAGCHMKNRVNARRHGVPDRGGAHDVAPMDLHGHIGDVLQGRARTNKHVDLPTLMMKLPHQVGTHESAGAGDKSLVTHWGSLLMYNSRLAQIIRIWLPV